MSQLDVINCLVSIDKYDPDKHFAMVFSLACEYLSSVHLDKDLDLSQAFIPQAANSTALGEANSVSSPFVEASTGNSAPSPIFRTTAEFLAQAKELTVELTSELNKGILSESYLQEVIATEVDDIYHVNSKADEHSKVLIVEILCHIVRLASSGKCLVATVVPKDSRSNSSASESAFIAGVLHYETGPYNPQFPSLAQESNLGTVAGYCFISKVYVKPSLRRQNIASELLRAAGDYAHQEFTANADVSVSLASSDTLAPTTLPRVLLFLDTIKTFAPAISLYESMGFKQLDEQLLPQNFTYQSNKLYLFTLR